MHRCYISYTLLQKYLSYATISGLLFHDHRSNEYHITSKGIQFLDYFDQYRDTEIELALKKSLISRMLENKVEESKIPNFEYRTDGMLTHTAA